MSIRSAPVQHSTTLSAVLLSHPHMELSPCQSTTRFLPALSTPNSSLESFYTPVPSRYRADLLTITGKLKCRASAEGAFWELRKKKKKALQEQKSLFQPKVFQHIAVITLIHENSKQGPPSFRRHVSSAFQAAAREAASLWAQYPKAQDSVIT